MMTDRIMALVALATFIVFAGIMAVKVARLDLGLAIGVGLALVVYDIWSQLFARRR